MYLLGTAGNFDCRVRVALDKEGSAHDVAWSPNNKEFGAVYGCGLISLLVRIVCSSLFSADMLVKTILFDQRARMLHDFGSAPHNTISFNPQSRFLFLAGFGNLAGKIDVFGRRMFNKCVPPEHVLLFLVSRRTFPVDCDAVSSSRCRLRSGT